MVSVDTILNYIPPPLKSTSCELSPEYFLICLGLGDQKDGCVLVFVGVYEGVMYESYYDI
jgi:hypothetical protein